MLRKKKNKKNYRQQEVIATTKTRAQFHCAAAKEIKGLWVNRQCFKLNALSTLQRVRTTKHKRGSR